MDDLPDEMLLKTSFTKQVLLIVTSAIFVLGGVLMIQDDQNMGWLVAIFFGLCILVFISQLTSGSGYLRLNREGFTLGTIRGNESTYRWQDIEEFGIWQISGNKFVSWNFVADYDRSKSARKLNKSIGAMEAMLPDNYGMKPVELLALLITYKEQSPN